MVLLKRMLIAVVVVLGCHGTAKAQALLECTLVDLVHLSREGFLVHDVPGFQWIRESFTVDLATGVMRFDGEQPYVWAIIQEGNEAWDWVLSPTFFGELTFAVREFVRINPRSTPMTFFMVRQEQVLAGTCAAL